MQLIFETATEIHDTDVERAWVGRDPSGRWQIVVVEWTARMTRCIYKRYTALYAKDSAVLTAAQVQAVLDVLQFKAAHGESFDGVTLEV